MAKECNCDRKLDRQICLVFGEPYNDKITVCQGCYWDAFYEFQGIPLVNFLVPAIKLHYDNPSQHKPCSLCSGIAVVEAKNGNTTLRFCGSCHTNLIRPQDFNIRSERYVALMNTTPFSTKPAFQRVLNCSIEAWLTEETITAGFSSITTVNPPTNDSKYYARAKCLVCKTKNTRPNNNFCDSRCEETYKLGSAMNVTNAGKAKP